MKEFIALNIDVINVSKKTFAVASQPSLPVIFSQLNGEN
jgi:hypothetical protein